MKEIDVAELQAELKRGDRSHIVIDVRTPEERTHERIRGTINIPLSRVGEQVDFLQQYDAVYVHCGTGSRSQKVCHDLAEQGLDNVVNIRGGVAAWDEHGFDVISQPGLSIMRQVRIAAGSLVVLGVVLTLAVSPYFIALPFFVGCGLIFAGVTNRCGLSAVLLRMPWNKLVR